IVTVTLMGTALDAMNRAFHKSISIIGADTLFVQRGSWLAHTEEEWFGFLKRREITWLQSNAVEKQMTLARGVAPVVVMIQSVGYQTRNARAVQVIGSTDQFLITSGFSIGQGRFITPMESEGGRPVCVIGTDVATNLFLNETPIGKRIRIGSQPLEVIGVLAKQGSFMGMKSLDNEVIIPIRQVLGGYWRNPDFQIQVKVNDIARIEEAKEELQGIMRKVRRLAPGEPDDFAINQQEHLISMFNRVAGIIATVGLMITGLSLFVGGIGIMNIMFVSVAERTREIGVRKAIGAKRRTILIQFLIEAATLCLIGGLVGLAITYLLTLVVGRFMPVPVSLSLPVMGVAILVSLLTGLLSGFFPAWRAARMDPVEALRNE
ncbi:MAG: ABC transporter permease, partial [Verrucomicrobiota bacterium]